MVRNAGNAGNEHSEGASNEGLSSQISDLISSGTARVAFVTQLSLAGLAVGQAASAQEIRVADLRGESTIISLSENEFEQVDGTLPDEIIITNSLGESFQPHEYGISNEEAIAFLQAAELIPERIREMFSRRFLELSPGDMAMAIQAFTAANTGDLDERAFQKLARGVIMFWDIRENVQFTAENGYVRVNADGEMDGGGIMRFAANLIEDYPEITLVLTPEYMMETQALYRSAVEAIRERTAQIQAEREGLQAETARLEAELEELIQRNNEMEETIRQMDELIAIMQTLVVASNASD